jgi:nucleotide-binding universal stress UspA family protein
MTPLRHVLVPIDFSACSLAAMRPAAAIARSGDAALTLLHVYPYGCTVDPVGSPYIPQVSRMGPQARDAVISGLSRVAGQTRPPLRRLHIVLREGDPSTEILHFADRHDVDVIAMGTHGRRGFDRVVLGSVAERVAYGAPCSVLTVRETRDSRVVPLDESHRVLCAVDLKPGSKVVVDAARTLADATGARLTLLHVVAAARLGDSRRAEEPEEPGYLPTSGTVHDQLRSLLGPGAVRATTDIVVEHGLRHDQIHRIAVRLEAAVLVVGTGKAASERGPFGLTVQQLVRRAPCPVFLARRKTALGVGVAAGRTELIDA